MSVSTRRAAMPKSVVASVQARRTAMMAATARHRPPLRADAGHTRDAVLRGALGLFAGKGFDACTMRDLAAAGGVTAPALYNHFQSKSQILAETLWLGFHDFFVEVLGPCDDEQPERWLEGVVRRHMLFQLENREVAIASDRLFGREFLSERVPARDADAVLAIERDYVELVGELAAAASGTTSAKRALVDAYAIVAACDRVAEWYTPDVGFTPAELATQTWQTVQRITARPRPRP